MNTRTTKSDVKGPSLAALVAGASLDAAGAVVRELRRARYDVTPRHVETLPALQAALREGDWDIVVLLLDKATPRLSPDNVLAALRDNGSEAPCIVVAEAVDVQTAVSLMRQGASDYIPVGELSRLGPAIARELREARARRRQTRGAKATSDAGAAGSAAAPGDADAIGEAKAADHLSNVNGANGANGARHSGGRTRQQSAAKNEAGGRNAGQNAGAEDERAGDESGGAAEDAPAAHLDEGPMSALVALTTAIGAQTDLAAIAHELSIHLRPLLPFDSVGISLSDSNDWPPLDGGRKKGASRTAQGTVQSAAKGVSNGAGAASGATRRNAAYNGSGDAASGANAAIVSDSGAIVSDSGDGTKTVWVASGAAEASGSASAAPHAAFASATLATASEPAARSAPGATPQPTMRTMLDVPLVAEGRVLGALHFAAARPDAFSPEHARVADAVAAQVAVTLRQSQELEMVRQAEEKFRFLFNNLDVILWEADPSDLRFTFVNARAEEWLGYPASRWVEPDFWATLLHPDDRERVLDELRDVAERGGDLQLEFGVVGEAGQTLHLRVLLNVEMRDGVAARMDGIMLDISDRRRSEAALRESNAILKATQEAAADGIFLLDDEGRMVSFNQRFIEMWRIPANMVDNLQAKQQLMAYVLSNLKDPEEFIEKMNAVFESDIACSRDEIYLNDGRIFSRHAAPALSPGGHSYGWVWSFSDITEHKSYELELARQASHDALTGLPNRTLFMDRLKRAVARGAHERRMTALLFLDLDRFKVINDSLGHEHGDRLLVELAHRLRACIRPGDTAARFGGDEFTILLEDIVSISEATRVAERIEDYLQTPFTLGGHEIFSSASIGIVISANGEDRAEVLLRHADVAMYRAKTRGGAQFEVFDSKMSALALERLQLEIDLRQALRRGQLHVHYQPQVHSRSGHIVGVEALARWDHPLRGSIPPSEFIPVAEETGMIFAIGQWVLREACTQARHWQTEIPREPPLEISVNLSARQFQQPGLVEEVARVLHETGLPAHSLVLEITESAVMEDEQTTMLQLDALKKLGVQLAIDDFGTGYSSLSYLERFNLDVLKIDRSFVNRIGDRGENTAIVRAVTTLGQALGVQVTAEGVETAEQLTQLRAMGCQMGQGFFFARPLPAADVSALLQQNPHW